MELNRYISPLLKWWWLLVASAVLAGVSSYFVVSQQPPTYRANATLMIGRAFEDPNPTGGELNLSQQLARTYADIAGRQPVREQAMALGLVRLHLDERHLDRPASRRPGLRPGHLFRERGSPEQVYGWELRVRRFS